RFPARALIPPPFAGGWGTLDQLQATLSWDLDFWGKNRAIFEQALGQARAAAVDAQAAQLALSVDIAHAYVQLTRAYLQLDRAQARHRRPALARGGGSPRHRRGSDAVLPGREPDGLRRLSEPGNLGLPGPGQPGARSRTRAEPAAVRRGAAPRQSGRRRCAVR